MAEVLIGRGALVEEPDAEPWATPLAWAVKMGYAAITALLREKGAKFQARLESHGDNVA